MGNHGERLETEHLHQVEMAPAERQVSLRRFDIEEGDLPVPELDLFDDIGKVTVPYAANKTSFLDNVAPVISSWSVPPVKQLYARHEVDPQTLSQYFGEAPFKEMIEYYEFSANFIKTFKKSPNRVSYYDSNSNYERFHRARSEMDRIRLVEDGIGNILNPLTQMIMTGTVEPVEDFLTRMAKTKGFAAPFLNDRVGPKTIEIIDSFAARVNAAIANNASSEDFRALTDQLVPEGRALLDKVIRSVQEAEKKKKAA